MPTYRYEAMGASAAAAMSGATIEAPDRGTALRLLLQRGVTPSDLSEVAAPATSALAGTGRGWGRTMSRSEMASFVRELSTALTAGLPLVQALRTMGRQGRSVRQRAMIDHLVARVESGDPLAEAAESWGRPFSELTVSMVRAGEASGRLGEVLEQASDLLDKDVKLRRQLMAATLYPAILGVLLIVAVVVVVTVIVPKIVEPLKGQIGLLPWPTRVLQGIASFCSGYWIVIVPLVVLAAWGLGRAYTVPSVRFVTDRTLLKIPVLGRLLRDVAVARFTRTLGTLTAAGLPILSALRITRATLNNRAMEAVVDEVCEQVSAGRTIAEPMERSGHFPPMLVQIVNLGERSGRLDQMLNQAARAFEDRTETSVRLFTTALPPVLVVIMACAVGFVVLSIMLPLLQAQDALK
ncbi:MAG: type II secretion system F family protein [Phycisphaerae bacterium]|nr:type II secretion system F family protein [Phycisphaerae bacterium]